jgi:predicted enzyme related to lactoylglutathione lyase
VITTDKGEPQLDTIAWCHPTADNAAEVRGFYSAVTGWKAEPVNMGEYDHFNMIVPGGAEAVAGIGHARGLNASLPPPWLIYIAVENIDWSTKRCVELGGRIIDGPPRRRPVAPPTRRRTPATRQEGPKVTGPHQASICSSSLFSFFAFPSE